MPRDDRSKNFHVESPLYLTINLYYYMTINRILNEWLKFNYTFFNYTYLFFLVIKIFRVIYNIIII